MKKRFFTLGLLAAFIFSCNPLEDTYTELDNIVTEDIDLVLTEDHYEWLDEEYGVGGFGNFSSVDEAKEFLPFLIDYYYSGLNNGSTVTVTYELYRGFSSVAGDYAESDEFVFSNEDYFAIADEVGENGFINNKYNPYVYIPSILEANVGSPAEGDTIVVKYEWADRSYETISGMSLVDESFSTTADFDQYTAVSLEGTQVWKHGSFSGDGYAGMSGYSGGNVPNTDWFLIENVDLSQGDDPSMEVRQVLNFLGAGVIGEDIAVKISTDYEGDVTTATWSNLEGDTWPSGSNYTPVTTTFDLSSYAGQTVTIGFYYHSTADFAPNWQVSEIDIEVGEPVETFTQNVFYEFSDDEWTRVGNVIYLDEEEYDAMGAPGNFDNFSSSVSPDDYLPIYLNANMPYAQEEDEVIIVYKYYSSSCRCVRTRGDVYTYLNNNWNKHEPVIEQTQLFAKEDGVWVPDNTIKYTLTSEDYDAIASNESLGTASGRSNLENFGNLSTYEWSKEDIIEAIGFILHENFPNSEVGQKYNVTYNTYPAGDLQIHLILNEAGEYVEVEK